MTIISKITKIATVTVAMIAVNSHLAMAQEIAAVEAVESESSAQVDAVANANDAKVAELLQQIKNIRGADHLALMQSVCELPNVVLSSNAQAACTGEKDAMPKLINDGSRFSSRGTGAEFNTLIANIENLR